MIQHRRSFLFLALALPVAITTIMAGDAPAVKSINISISDSLIRGQTTPAAAMIQVQPLSEVFAIVGGVRPQFSFDSPELLAKNLQDGKAQLGVISGIELGWLGDKANGLSTMAVANTSDIKMKAYALMRKDNKSSGFSELKGKRLALPRRTQQHTQIFLHDSINRCGCQPLNYFSTTSVPADTDAAIEAVLEREVDVVVIDGQSWEVFQERKSSRAKRLMIVAESPYFPTAALIYNPGKMPEGDVKKMRDGLFSAHQQPFCRQILNFWRISQFVPASPEYDQLVKNIVKDFPNPIIPANFTNPK